MLTKLRHRLWFWWNFRLKGLLTPTLTPQQAAVAKRKHDLATVASWLQEVEAEGLEMTTPAIVGRLSSEFYQGTADDHTVWSLEAFEEVPIYRDDISQVTPERVAELLHQRSLA